MTFSRGTISSSYTSFTDNATQFVDDKGEMLNAKGANIDITTPKQQQREQLFTATNQNTKTWTDLLWISGGNLVTSKCFFYYIHPSFDYNTCTIKYETTIKAPGQIFSYNHTTGTQTELQRVEPTNAKRTLGIILAPNASSTKQINHIIELAREYTGKLKNSKLSSQAKRTALSTILVPKLQYPLMANYCNTGDLMKLEKIIARANCHALGLNEHFQRAVLYGPYHLGGMAIPSIPSKTLTYRLTYFLYHIRLSTKLSKKLEASLAFLQLETGLFGNFFSHPFTPLASWLPKRT